MRASSKRLISIFIALILIGATAYVVFNVNAPTWRRVQGLRQEVAEKERVRNQLAELVAKAKEALARFEDLDRQAAPISAALPAKPNLPEVLAILGALATDHDLTLGQVTFEELTSRQLAPTTEEAPKAVPIKVLTTLSGGYADFKNWLKAAESELRLIDIDNLSIQPLSTRPGEAVFNFSLGLTVYYQPKPELITPSR